MNKWASIGISALVDFVINAGGAYLIVATAGTGVVLPTAAQVIVAVITGLVQAARGVQKILTPPPV